MHRKSTFIFNYDWREALKAYPAEVRLEVYETLIDYSHTGEMPENLSPMANLAFLLIKREIDFNHERYEAIVEKRRRAAVSRWKKDAAKPEEAKPAEAQPAAEPEQEAPEDGQEQAVEPEEEEDAQRNQNKNKTDYKTSNNSNLTMRNITEIIVHCTATPEGDDYRAADIRRWHKEKGFADIGYHYVVDLDGRVERGRSEASPGAHCRGHNRSSIGVCYVGGCPPRSVAGWASKSKDTRTAAQKRALATLIADLKRRYPGAKVYGHRDFAQKACPAFDAKMEYG